MKFTNLSSKKISPLISVLLSVCFIAIMAIPQTQAQTTAPSTYTVLAPLPCIESSTVTCPGGNGSLQNTVTFQQYVQYSMNLLIALAAVAAVFMIVWGGFEYMTSASFSTKSDGLAKVRNAIYGLVLVLASYLIIRTIDPRFVNISSSLVPQLQLMCEGQPGVLMTDPTCRSNQIGDLLTQALQYNQNGQMAIDAAKASQNAIAALNTQKTALQTQLTQAMQSSDETAITNLQNQIANIDNKIQDQQASIIVNAAKSVMDNGGVSQTLQNVNNLKLQGNFTPDQIDKQINSGVASLNQTASTRENDLNKIGAYSQDAVIEEKKNEDSVALQLSGVSAKADAEWSALGGLVHGTGTAGFNSLSSYKANLNAQLDSISASQMSNVTDPTVQKQLQDQLATVRAKVNNLK